MKTIKQIADNLGVSKQKVYRFIKNNDINESLQKNGVMYYDEVVENIIKSAFLDKTTSNDSFRDAHHSASNDALNDALIQMLKNELEIKNKQIDELNARLAEAHQMANSSQELHKAEKVQQILLNDVEKKGFFNKFFKK